MIKKILQRFYLVLIFVLLYAPIVTLMVLSFNKSKTRSKWGGFTTKWYVELFRNEQIMNALYTNPDHSSSVRPDRDDHRNGGGNRDPGHAPEIPHHHDGGYQHSHAECRIL